MSSGACRALDARFSAKGWRYVRRAFTDRPRARHRTVRPGHMRTYVRALEQPDARCRGATTAARLSRRGRRTALRRSRGARDTFLRGPRALDPQPGARSLADAVPLDDQSLQGLQPCVLLLLRPSDAHLPGLRRGPRLRAGDRRQGQRARAAARGARTAVVEAR